MEVNTTIWPYEVVRDPQPPSRATPNHLRCFLISPFSPKDRFDDIFSLVAKACETVAIQLSCTIECVRADKIKGSGVIHPEIWHEIQTADVVVADVSGLNGNVMIELGVASACRKKEHVIIIKEENPDERFLFDISPVRHIIYKRTSSGFQELFNQLVSAILIALTSAPFELETGVAAPSLPLEIDFAKGRDVDWLVGPAMTHRRLLNDCLEFGSLYIFQNSWLSVRNLDISNLRISAELKFTKVRDVEGWFGINIRCHHFFANFGHLLYLTTTGKVIRTVPQGDLSPPTNDTIGTFDSFNPLDDRFHKFLIEADSHSMKMHIDEIGNTFKIADMPHVFPSGKILVQTYNCRVGIKNISIAIT